MKKFGLLKSLLISTLGIASFGSLVSITSCGNKDILVTQIDLDKTDVEMNEGDTVEIKATVLPSDATNKTIRWTSSNQVVAEVGDAIDNTVIIKANKAGIATIIAMAADGSEKKATCNINVVSENNWHIEAITVSEESTIDKFYVGDELQLICNIFPSYATDKYVTIWTSGDKTVATVDEKGLVTGVGAGETTITVTVQTQIDGKEKTFSADYKVNVLTKPKTIDVDSVVLDERVYEINKDIYNTLHLNPKVLPSDATNQTLIWESSDESIATVDNNGVIARGIGKATITATAHNGKSATCDVIVTNNIISKCCAIGVQKASTLKFHQAAPENSNGVVPNLQIASVDKKSGEVSQWTEINLHSNTESLALETNKIYLLKGRNTKGWDIYNEAKGKWEQNGNIRISNKENDAGSDGDVWLCGSINALVDGGTGMKDFPLTSRCFSSLFTKSTDISIVSPNFLPSTNLGPMCYNGLFSSCTSLTHAPNLPAIQLQPGCYASMFKDSNKLDRIKIFYEDTFDKQPDSAFTNWVHNVASYGTFYYNGESTAHEFGFQTTWSKVKFN